MPINIFDLFSIFLLFSLNSIYFSKAIFLVCASISFNIAKFLLKLAIVDSNLVLVKSCYAFETLISV